jgi:ribosome-interacting GTPase 1
MPANLTPEYLKADKQYKQAKSPEEKLDALQIMLATIPKHKGTEKMQADLKRKISQANKEIQKGKGKKGGTSYIIKKEGAGQVCLVGLPNAGKSQLLAALTNANPEISETPFSTKRPYPGMAVFENIQIQIIDLPPIYPNYRQPWMYEIIKNCDIVLLVIDVSRDDIIEQIDIIKEDLKNSRISLISPNSPPDSSIPYAKKTVLIANKIDIPSSKDFLPIIYELFEKDFIIIPISSLEKKNLNSLKSTIFENLEIIRVYSKPPGKPPDKNQPFIFPKGSTILTMAEAIHKDFKSNIKYARIWGRTDYNGLRVPKDYVLKDGDIIEIHI